MNDESEPENIMHMYVCRFFSFIESIDADPVSIRVPVQAYLVTPRNATWLVAGRIAVGRDSHTELTGFR